MAAEGSTVAQAPEVAFEGDHNNSYDNETHNPLLYRTYITRGDRYFKNIWNLWYKTPSFEV